MSLCGYKSTWKYMRRPTGRHIPICWVGLKMGDESPREYGHCSVNMMITPKKPMNMVNSPHDTFVKCGSVHFEVSAGGLSFPSGQGTTVLCMSLSIARWMI